MHTHLSECIGRFRTEILKTLKRKMTENEQMITDGESLIFHPLIQNVISFL